MAMGSWKYTRAARILIAACGAVTLLFAPRLRGQALAREALSSLPADTQQLAYTNLADLRRLPSYAQIQKRLLIRQLREFEDAIRPMGIDPDKDIDEVILGWRGQDLRDTAFFGIAEGHFSPERIQEYFAKHKLRVLEYEVWNLYAVSSGKNPTELFFAFLDSSSAAFGRLDDVKAVLEVRAGTRAGLDSNPAFLNQKAELEGTVPQWGIATGKAVAVRMKSWLAPGEKSPWDISALLGPVEALVYKVEWSRNFSTRISIVCRSSQGAEALAQLLALWRNSEQATGNDPPPPLVASLSQLDVQVSGTRVELSASGPIESLDPILRGSPSASAP